MAEELMGLLKKRGFAFPSFEIYGGVRGFYDYGPQGVRLKKNVEDMVRRHYVASMGCLEVECNTLGPEDVYKASGHVDSFADAVVECVKCGQSYRADHLIEEDTGVNMEGKGLDELAAETAKIPCPNCRGSLGMPYQYNMMFKTSVGPGKNRLTAYLRPETAQTTYLDFPRLWEYARKKLPFGVLQIGRSYRNEISPRQGMLRLREFSQAEIQCFLDPEDLNWMELGRLENLSVRMLDGQDRKHESTVGEAFPDLIPYQPIAYHLASAWTLFTSMGIDEERLRLRQHRLDERSFYSRDTWDIEYMSGEFGWIEMVGVAYRTDYDLTQHIEASGKNMGVNVEGRRFTPHVVEVAFGIDRPAYCILESSRDERGFGFPMEIAPYKAGVFPLVKKDGIAEKAYEVHEMISSTGVYCFYDKSGSIGKRYARADEVGVPYCITVDYDTLEDETVTVRKRGDKSQERVEIKKLGELF